MKRGPKSGLPRGGSTNSWLFTFEVGERRYVDTTVDTFEKTMRTALPPKIRRPAALQSYEFKASTFTAVPAVGVGEGVRYLICVERVK